MSTASLVPETWELSGDDAWRTLRETGRRRLLRDSFIRMRVADGFTHVRSLAFLTSLVMVQAVIALVGLASALGDGTLADGIVRAIQNAVPGPAGELLTAAVHQAHEAGVAKQYAALLIGGLGALVSGTTAMGQLERGLNRLYGVEQDRPMVRKYGLGLLLAITAGMLLVGAFVAIAFGRSVGTTDQNHFADTAWGIRALAVAFVLLVAAMALLFRLCPRRRQPAWSWLTFGAFVSVLLWFAATLGLGLFFSVSTSFGDTYGPLAGLVALLLWALLSAMSVFFGAAVAAQLEAVRAGRSSPQDKEKVAESEPDADRMPVGGGTVTVTADEAIGAGEPSDERARLRRTLEGVIGVPATEGNRVDVLRNGDEIFPAMLEAIGEASHTIDFLTFVYWEGEIGAAFAAALAERAKAGLRVRVLLDAVGAHTMSKEMLACMEDGGVEVRWFRPLRRPRLGQLNHRTHRKVMIADEAIGFTGGVGIADEWQGDARNEHEWRDTHFRIQGPAVDGLRAAFLDNWAETDPVLFTEGIDRFPDQPSPGEAVIQCVRGASETGWSDVATLFRTLLQVAQRRLRVTTAYFVPDDDLCDRICAAAERGVEVEALVPGPHIDKRFVQIASEAVFDRLLDAGVRIWSYQPTMLHAKVMTVDGVVANLGSANLNGRSVSLDEEINAVALDPGLVSILDDHFDEDLERSVRIDSGRWRRRSLTQRTLERVVAPARRLL